MSQISVDSVIPQSGTTITVGASGDTVNLGSGASTNGFLPSAIAVSGTDFQFNSGYGSTATAYGCRAWVFFNGTGTVSINESGNVSSITDNGTGNFTINFATAMPDSNYVSAALFTNTGTNYTRGPGGAYITGQTSSQFTVLTCYGSDATTNGGLIDKVYNEFSFFR